MYMYTHVWTFYCYCYSIWWQYLQWISVYALYCVFQTFSIIYFQYIQNTILNQIKCIHLHVLINVHCTTPKYICIKVNKMKIFLILCLHKIRCFSYSFPLKTLYFALKFREQFIIMSQRKSVLYLLSHEQNRLIIYMLFWY